MNKVKQTNGSVEMNRILKPDIRPAAIRLVLM